jgi:ABC-type maltose transport system permease subunit
MTCSSPPSSPGQRARPPPSRLQIFATGTEGGAIPYYGQTMMAAALVCAAPVVLLYLFLQKYLVGGMTAGGVK